MLRLLNSFSTSAQRSLTLIEGPVMKILLFLTLNIFALTNYDILKPYHIQQDKSDGCSLASFLMIMNSLSTKGEGLTQEELRNELRSSSRTMNYWLRRVSGRGRGVSLSNLEGYIEKARRDLDLPLMTVTKKQRKYFSFNTFKKDVLKAINNSNVYIILNFESHWSPLGNYEEGSNEITILDVDYMEDYTEEFTYLPGEGELYIDIETFYKRWAKHRGYILLEVQ